MEQEVDIDWIISTRVDEVVAERIGSLARRLPTARKRVIETAIERYAAEVEPDAGGDVFSETCGAWRRKEAPSETVETARRVFRESMRRRR